MLNIPIGDTLAVRLVLSDTYRSGWINNVTVQPFPISLTSTRYTANLATLPVTNTYKDANDLTLYGGRVSLKYQPSDDFSILAFAMTNSLIESKYKYLLLTEHLPHSNSFAPNIDKPTGPGIRLRYESGVVLTRPPFNMQAERDVVLCQADVSGTLIQTRLYQFA